MQESISAESLSEIIEIELQAIHNLLEGDVGVGAATLDDAARRLDEMLAGEGRVRLTHRIGSTTECIRFLLEMFPYQVDALRRLEQGNLDAARQKLHGHASVLWRLAAYLHDLVGSQTSKVDPVIVESRLSHYDDKRERIIETLDDLLEGEDESVSFHVGETSKAVVFLKRRDALQLRFAVASLDEVERSRALYFFQRVGSKIGEWDERSVADDDFWFCLDMGIHLDRSARITIGILREIFSITEDFELRIVHNEMTQ